MIRLQYFDGKKWVEAGHYTSDDMAWIALGRDNLNYRTIDKTGLVLRDTSNQNTKGTIIASRRVKAGKS